MVLFTEFFSLQSEDLHVAVGVGVEGVARDLPVSGKVINFYRYGTCLYVMYFV